MTDRHRLQCGDHTRSAQVADFVGRLCRCAGLPPNEAYWLRLATDEITTNIVQHGYQAESGIVDLVGEVEPDRVWIRIEDDAPPFDPRSHDPRARLAEPLETRPEGGLGLMLALSRLDEFAYDHDGRRNRNTLVMRRRGPPADPTDQGDRDE